MRVRILLIFFSLALILSACGTVIDGQTQTVRIDTPGAYEAECSVNNGVRYTAQNGETIKVQRSSKPLELDCYGSGNRRVLKTVESTFNPWSAAIPPGAVYDHFSGGLYEYPSIIAVDFVGVPTHGFELPAYHNKDAPNPYKQTIESYNASTARITEDSVYMKRGVQKRDAGADANPFAEPSSGVSQPDVPAGAGMTPLPPVPKGLNAEALTRSMNPTVFNK